MALRDKVVWILVIAAAWAFYSQYFYNWWEKANVNGLGASFGYAYLGALIVIIPASVLAWVISRR